MISPYRMPPHKSRCVSRMTAKSRLNASPSTYATTDGKMAIAMRKKPITPSLPRK